ncbi:hypothetical protein B0T10DRAFT_469532 [Thelonectria olida]|uniref:DUF7918 domain-containing protein n=1 Tax=Thelonectria olida TaxID=1576542 RepID=A0A9P8WHK1_9HYPO|nr:hypothetical protein B0T10DRAFT_469532 [Thelonectria olida]
MAVLPAVPGLSVHIQVAGERATEYPDEERADASKPLKSHCYIESKDGEEFAIETTVTPGFPLKNGHDTLWSSVKIDGSRLHLKRNTIRLKAARETTEARTCSEVLTASEDPRKINANNLVFVPVVTNEDQHGLETCDPNVPTFLGTIAVRVSTGISGEPTVFNPPKVDRKASIGVHEKLLKGKDLTHGSSLSSGHVEANPAMRRFTDSARIGTFYFYYRSHEALQRQLIIPRSPSPSSTSSNDDQLEDLTEEQIRNLARERLRDVKAENARSIKRGGDSPRKDLRPLKLMKLEDGTEAFDLTED